MNRRTLFTLLGRAALVVGAASVAPTLFTPETVLAAPEAVSGVETPVETLAALTGPPVAENGLSWPLYAQRAAEISTNTAPYSAFREKFFHDEDPAAAVRTTAPPLIKPTLYLFPETKPTMTDPLGQFGGVTVAYTVEGHSRHEWIMISDIGMSAGYNEVIEMCKSLLFEHETAFLDRHYPGYALAPTWTWNDPIYDPTFSV